jgi:uncharacterized protein YndB with AHSA1/START domain
VKPGGVWRFVMHGPDGRDYQNKITYLEVVRPERLVYKHGGEEDLEPVQFQTTVTFEEFGAQTKVTLRMVFPSAEERDRVVKEYGAIEGGQQTLARLSEHLASTAGTSGGANRELVITRMLDAPRELVFGMWTEAKHVAQWWGPHGFTNPVCGLDVREGGALRIHMRGPDGTIYPCLGVFREIVAPERLVFTSGLADEAGQTRFEALNTVTFADRDGRTELMLQARVFAIADPASAVHLDGMEAGWTQSLERLADHLAAIDEPVGPSYSAQPKN